jgi:hypothetical protein
VRSIQVDVLVGQQHRLTRGKFGKLRQQRRKCPLAARLRAHLLDSLALVRWDREQLGD